ncbi:hypothetical protein ACU5P1_17040 [Pseudomonas plecoglossicida]|uniref:Uncharacterized protein n=1 Tax=Pseudomonas plecoglossicida TaxID=70775 RepID=A0AAD0VT00_PSEDL|nr:hypothetical protein [Pseudomonas plecoglossicida]AXM95622.1 hypothetical protein DVB73_07330 [Pseudomonas plecoglossicida]EPB94435.1 hypothetical protein L321_18867 [Pseudomonas plecoglossicida NB2011]QLB56370.1 hypothetical protein HAV28_16870 [Pseudomonas plecoglossicida]
MNEMDLTVSSNIYEAGVRYVNGEISVEGIIYGTVDGEPVDGDRMTTHRLHKAWVGDMGIGLQDSQGNRYLVIDFDEMQEFALQKLHLLLGLAYLGEAA